MFDMLTDNILLIIGLLIFMWIIQFGFSYVQMQKFYKRLKFVRKDGLTAVGMDGSQYKGRSYGILTVDANENVIHAEKMSGWTNFAGLKPVPELVGMTLNEIRDENMNLPLSKKLHSAFRNAAKDLQEADSSTPSKNIASKQLSKK